MPKALLVYPEFPPSYWSGKYALEFLGRKSAMPPLGLLTIAALFPSTYELRLVDMNVQPLSDEDLRWADQVFLSAMIVQRTSFAHVAERAKKLGKTVIAGGPFPTSFYDEIENVDHFVLGEVEDFFDAFLEDLAAGRAEHIYRPKRDERSREVRPDMKSTPPPRYDLIRPWDYGSMALQFSRGCPFDCEFCDITKLFGRVPRSKCNQQMIAELEVLLRTGWRGPIFLVDDNFIGNKQNVYNLLPALIDWQKSHNYPFSFFTEASVNLAEMPDLMELMAQAGFDAVFLGLETPNPAALKATNKTQNIKQDDPDYLLNAVKKIQNAGMEVTAGFILGLDGDGPEAFDAQIDFIQRAGIPQAMVGLLNALKGTKLYDRLRREGRLLEESDGNNVSTDLNFVPQLDKTVLVEGYKRVLSHLYDRSLSNYFERCYILVQNWKQRKHVRRKMGKAEYMALFRSLTRQIFSAQGPAYLKFLLRVILHHFNLVPEAIRMAILGYHFERVTRRQVAVDEFCSYLETERQRVQQMLSHLASLKSAQEEARTQLQQCFANVHKRYCMINRDFRTAAQEALIGFQEAMNAQLEQMGKAFSG